MYLQVCCLSGFRISYRSHTEQMPDSDLRNRPTVPEA